MTPPSTSALERAAKRAVQSPFFLAGVLHAYQTANELDAAAFAAFLGCAPADLPVLALCRRPDADAPTFLGNIEHLARRFKLDPDRLIAVIREVDALQALRDHLAAASENPQILLAARDRDADPEPSDSEEADND